jgi:hypothetical protein
MNPHPVHHGSAVLHHFTAGHKQQLEIHESAEGEARGRRGEFLTTETQRTQSFGNGLNFRTRILSNFLLPRCPLRLCGK